MKLPATLLILSAVVGLSCVSYAETSPVSIQVEKAGKLESKEKEKSKTERRTLKITVMNTSKAEVTVKVKYTWFGHAIGSHDVVIVDQGDRDATVKPSGSEIVETPATSVTSIEAHYGPDKKKVDASGNKILGYAVQAFIGDKMVAENYEPESMKDQVGKAVVAKKEEVKK